MKNFTALAAALLATATPLTASHAAAPAKSVGADEPAKNDAKKDMADAFNPAQIFAMFEKLFPPGPEPAPERLALSKVAVQGLFPDGSYVGMMDAMMTDIADRVLNMSEADFEPKGKDGKPPSTLTLRQSLAKDDPAFEERYKIVRRVLGEEMVKIGAIIEPKMREGLARSMARRFDPKQIADLNAFLSTDSGRAFGRQSLAMWFDGDIMRGIFASVPELIPVLPGVVARIESETAHLPKIKKAEAKKDSAKAEKK